MFKFNFRNKLCVVTETVAKQHNKPVYIHFPVLPDFGIYRLVVMNPAVAANFQVAVGK